MPLAPELEALDAVGGVLLKSLQQARQDLEREGRALEELRDPRRQLEAIAEAEREAREELARRQVQLEVASLQCRARAAEPRQQQEHAETVREQVDEDMWQVVAWGMDIVPLDVGGAHFEASAETLRRSPWFARRLAELPALPPPPPRARESRARRRARLRVERDGGLFGTVLSYLRLGGDGGARDACAHLLQCLGQRERAGLLEEALFFELPGLMGLVADPPVGASVELQLPSEELVTEGLDALFFHRPCNTWHAPGKCFDLRCIRGGVATVQGQVVAYRHDSEPLWTVEFHGQRLAVPRSCISAVLGAPMGSLWQL